MSAEVAFFCFFLNAHLTITRKKRIIAVGTSGLPLFWQQLT
jgi:hypothetical protein